MESGLRDRYPECFQSAFTKIEDKRLKSRKIILQVQENGSDFGGWVRDKLTKRIGLGLIIGYLDMGYGKWRCLIE